ncbi:tRNA (adenosine(37)-N6)-threonylcarbamoyltransferase complex ATPase subunit type 1 TsaE [Paenibacillus sp. GD4]|jgi:tRNA threonylcarbamoyladenosine biosynthesis protein TsaE|uniref:tRNA (adenosine(37)-N6)-threonylcarbamoyltransferase complex ATPase subunit type 1 TsaE n=1 Tax=Paenibacillus sp. GD4 TaxID=3068890 RepID=UPI0027965667|nr:tRNA (adenosine(37)-N6)-threonylcarbamoyltransferase complex ATPase subunit type 1 TsaE [Paenibacillus sp. GD4]MDQ1910637.1 tRNA (adenosine(37)-N6)-threonylcarbamoyltransferase complex ATPase subunit type 1 TsaE [Paenibacillus sp. GD4]
MMKETYQYTAEGLADTEALAERLASLFIAGTVITLDGDLGAGKTTFSQSVARAIGVTDVVNSPTFTIIKEYEGERFPFYHMDVYRLSMEEADDLGLDDYFYGDGITLVEWASLIEDLLPPDRLEITIEHLGDSGRRFRLQPYGGPYEAWCLELKKNGLIV